MEEGGNRLCHCQPSNSLDQAGVRMSETIRIKLPLTGTLISLKPLLGDDNDPVRVINLDLGDVSWQAVFNPETCDTMIDVDKKSIEVDVQVPRHKVKVIDAQGEHWIPEPEDEYLSRRKSLFDHLNQLQMKPMAELYAATGEKPMEIKLKT